MSFYIMNSGMFEQDTFRGQNTYWVIVLFSLLLLIAGVCILSKGWIRAFFPFVFMSDEDLSEYNVEKISFMFGVLLAIFSFIFLFATIKSMMVVVSLLIIGILLEVSLLYAAASDRFKSDASMEF